MSKISYLKYHRDKVYLENEGLFRNILLKRYALLLRSSRAKPGKVLEIGCSVGTMLDIFKENGWETWGVEPSKSGHIAKAKGHRVLNAFFEDLPAGRQGELPKNYFDLVILNHTLEHMDDPVQVLKKAKGHLKNAGIIFVDVPNAGGLGAKILGEHWPYRLPEEHKHQFTKESLSRIFKEAGFKVIHFESRSGLFEYKNPFLELWQSLTGLKKRFFFDLFTLPYALCATLLNMGDSMSFIGAFKKTPDFESGDELNAHMSSSLGRGNRGLKSAEDVIAKKR